MSKKQEIERLRKEIDFLYLYPSASMSRIERKEKELECLIKELKDE